jgi:hypothetical protein
MQQQWTRGRFLAVAWVGRQWVNGKEKSFVVQEDLIVCKMLHCSFFIEGHK